MAIKIIKFDLPINGTKVTTLEALRDNLTDEIVPLARSGQLERWFKSRQMPQQAQAVAAAVSQHAEDKALFLALCAVLEVEVHPDDASAIFDAPPEAGQHIKGGKYFDLYEELKKSYEAMQESASNRIDELESAIEKIFTTKSGVVSLDQNGPRADFLMSVKFEEDELRDHLKQILGKSTKRKFDLKEKEKDVLSIVREISESAEPAWNFLSIFPVK